MTTKNDDDTPPVAKAQETPMAPTDGAGNKNLLDKDIPTAKDEPAMPARMMDDSPVPKRDQVQILIAKEDVTTHPFVFGVNGVFHEIETGKPTTIDRRLLRNLDDMGIAYTLVK